MKGLFIPEITAEEFGNGCLESIEALMAEGAIYDIEYPQPCEDAVSRQKVLQCIKESREGIDWGQSEDEDAFLHYSAALYRTIASKECLPPVTPQPKSGEWIDKGHDYYFPKFCPHCGARMNGGGEE